MLPLRTHMQAVNLVMPYLIVIVTVAVRFGRGPALLATLISALCYNYFFVGPYYSFKFTEEHHIVTFFVLMVTGFIVGTQTSRLRLKAIFSRRREENISTLYDMTRELTATRGKTLLAEVAARHVAEVMDGAVSIWVADGKDQLSKLIDEGGAEGEEIDTVREESAARWAFTHKLAAGLGTETLPSANGLYVPLVGSSGVIGVLGIIPESRGKALSSDKLDLLDTLTSLAATALERANVAELVEKTILETEGERLRNILLSSVSHDLRTPLASITGAASTLLLEGNKITDEYKGELLRLIHEEGARLARIVTNLLDVTSLESGSVRLNKELYFIEELIGSALMRTEPKLGMRTVVTKIDPGLPLVRMDGLLIEQVLINLLENVADHTPPDAHVTISVKLVRPDIHVIVSDNGPGVPAGDEERIFDKFYSAEKKQMTIEELVNEGGMGLAICRGIVMAHGGKIWAQNKQAGGAAFTFTLPVKGQDE
jgi:two-component system sensor histidine kinase KdpD